STTALESGLSVRVSDYDPATGKSAPLSNGLLTASLRAVDESRSRYIGDEMIQPWHPFTKASVLPVTPNEPMLLPVEIFPTSAMIAK
ncbi:CocE/NonD family hydrolase C-terminal non-catalytic domain-containing protein, partial [Acinetobacter baumannii]